MKRFNKRSDIRLNENFAIYFAMLNAGFKRKLKADPVQHATAVRDRKNFGATALLRRLRAVAGLRAARLPPAAKLPRRR